MSLAVTALPVTLPAALLYVQQGTELPWLAIIALVLTAISAYFYLRVVMVMYMRDPQPVSRAAPRFVASPAMTVVLACALAGVVLLGLFPNVLVSLTTQSVLILK